MSESDGEQAARSLALEQAYVHEVYEQCADRTIQSRQWPRIYQFLEELEPGALVCDIGCGNGKYLNVNHNVFKVGVDRSQRFANIARGKDNEVLTCDNLSLPFRDESFDAVLSIAVVHHFSTTERRVRAIKELTRVLRIGGRVVISVWAMEQKHRKFESQDVLVPWPKAYGISSTGGPLRVRGASCDERHRGKSAHHTYLMSTKRASSSSGCGERGGDGKAGGTNGGGKGYWIDPFSPSPSTSSLSSPNETCYSFIRRALQKLAGGRRNSRAWFLENWQNNGKERRSYDGEYCDEDECSGGPRGAGRGSSEDAGLDLPIELRRLEARVSVPGGTANGGGVTNQALDAEEKRARMRQQHSDSLSVKSKSLSSIVEAQRTGLVRSRSSIPGLCASPTNEQQLPEQQQQRLQKQESGCAIATTKPRLVKQKKHLEDATYDDDENDENDDKSGDRDPANYTAIRHAIGDVVDPAIVSSNEEESSDSVLKQQQQQLLQRNVHKQSSMNEELMSIERLRERESVRKNIMKQASLNEELIYKARGRPTSASSFEAFKDSLYASVSATRRFQLLKTGLTSRLRQSTTNIEKATSGMSIKNGFVRILQSWKSTESPDSATTNSTTTSTPGANDQQQQHQLHFQHQQQQQMHSSRCSQSSTSRWGDELAALSSERRLSREDGSDSSKDSSLQSDTSVDSEDSCSLPSVIYNPRRNSSPRVENAVAPPVGMHQLSLTNLQTASAPPSPRVKLASVSPLLKQQFPATSKSLPPPSPPGLSPHTLNIANMRPFFSGNEVILTPPPPPPPPPSFSAPAPAPAHPRPPTTNATTSLAERLAEVKRSFDAQPLIALRSIPRQSGSDESPTSLPAEPPHAAAAAIPSERIRPRREEKEEKKEVAKEENKSTREQTKRAPLRATKLNERAIAKKDAEAEEDEEEEEEREESRKSRLNEIKELLSQKPGFATRTRTNFPIVRRASTANSGRLETVTKVLPRLLSLELFNPLTDDVDSDSSGVDSSPESTGSVVSVISDERYISKAKESDKSCLVEKKAEPKKSENEQQQQQQMRQTNPFIDYADVKQRSTSSDTQAKSARPVSLDTRISPVESTWNEECNRQLNDLTDRLSGGKLIRDIDEFCRTSKSDLVDDYLNNLAYSQRGRTAATSDDSCNPDNKDNEDRNGNNGNGNEEGEDKSHLSVQRSCSEESDAGSSHSGFVIVTREGEILQNQQNQTSTSKTKLGQQRYGNSSIESSDIGDSIENTISSESSSSNYSNSRAASETRKLCTSSTASLASSSLASSSNEPAHQQARLRLSAQPRSASEEIPGNNNGNNNSNLLLQRHTLGHTLGSPSPLLRRRHQQQQQFQHQQQPSRRSATSSSTSYGTLSSSHSSSQESLPSDQMTYHQYYHVFREGELDQLIDKYVENLHVISSYYDQSSWCIVAEKVQVWTI